jgi:hydroxymethylbilane synthase
VSSGPVVIGTRGSRLALRQTEITLAGLQAAHPETLFQVREIHTSGDRSDRSLSEIGGRGVFVIELESALLERHIDVAVHSLKDLPSDETEGLTLAALLPRDDPRDALISRSGSTLGSLPPDASVGTGSPRRAAQLRAMRSDLRIEDIRGNIDTRLRKVEEGQYDAVVLAAAGLARLGWLDRASEIVDIDKMLPAVGQGAIAVQVRTDDERVTGLVRTADDAATRAAVTAERAFERRLGAGCQSPIAAYALIDSMALRLRALVGNEDGSIIRGDMEGHLTDAGNLGIELAERLIDRGAVPFLPEAVGDGSSE